MAEIGQCKILFVVGSLGGGGLERQLYYVLQTMDRTRFKPAVAVWDYRQSDAHIANIRSINVPIYSLSDTASGPAKLVIFRALCKRLQPEVVHSYSFYTNVAAYCGASAVGAIAMGSIRSDFEFDKKNVGGVLGRINARWPAHQICNSHVAALNVSRCKRGFVPKKVYVVRNGLDLDRFPNYPLKQSETIRIVAIGSLLPEKRWDRLLWIAAELKKKRVDCAIRIAGEGPLRPALVEQAEQYGVGNLVEFLGYRNDIDKLLADSTFLVHTADREGCPNVVMEAMACGRPVIATDSGDIRFLVEDGRTGFVFPKEDSSVALERIITLARNCELMTTMGAAARAKAEKEFGLERLVAETLQAYRDAGWMRS